MLNDVNIERFKCRFSKANCSDVILGVDNLENAFESFIKYMSQISWGKLGYYWILATKIVNHNLSENHKLIKLFYKVQIKLAKRSANDKYLMGSQNSCKATWSVINAETGRISENSSQSTSTGN